jgi:hypothetical protein
LPYTDGVDESCKKRSSKQKYLLKIKQLKAAAGQSKTQFIRSEVSAPNKRFIYEFSQILSTVWFDAAFCLRVNRFFANPYAHSDAQHY